MCSRCSKWPSAEPRIDFERRAGRFAAVKVVGLVYESYSTGFYGSHRSGGVTLQFISMGNSTNYYAIFNAELTRIRNSRGHSAGSNLLNGHFRVGRRSGFLSFWRATGLTLPPRLSSFHDYMGNLKSLEFTAEIVKGTKLSNKTILIADQTASPDKVQTSVRQEPYIRHTDSPYKHLDQSQINTALHAEIATCESKYGKSKQVNANISTSTDCSVALGVDEWLEDYERAEAKGLSEQDR